MTTGGSSSATVTVKELVAVLPEGSVAVYVTVETPTLNTVPLAWLIPVIGLEAVVAPVEVQVSLETEQLSVGAASIPATAALHAVEGLVPDIALAMAGMVGGKLSTTVITICRRKLSLASGYAGIGRAVTHTENGDAPTSLHE